MGLVRFIIGILGILLTIGTFLSFLPMALLGGLATGSTLFVLGFPVLMMILGASMVYFGFYYNISLQKSNIQIITIAKWGLIYSIAVLLANYVVNRFVILNNFSAMMFTAIFVSIIVQIVRSHESRFSPSWFIFYLLVYANVLWLVDEFIIPKIFFQTSFYSSILTGFILAGVAKILEKTNINRHSLFWFSTVLLILLLATNLESITTLINTESSGIQPMTPNTNNSFNPTVLQKDAPCPIPMIPSVPVLKSAVTLNSPQISGTINSLLDTSIWRIESDIRPCYKGRYKGQHPDSYYCDDMIVSRWQTTSSGTITYRWYTAVTAEWKPKDEFYIFDGFSCEGSKKVAVDKDVTAYYVHISRDGTEIKVEY